MAVTTEMEDATHPNDTTTNGAGARNLATTLQGGDENLRLGFEVHGAIDSPTDQDVYSFQATAGTQVWINIDRTTFSLDSVLELVDANGNLLATSDNKLDETGMRALPQQVAGILAQPLGRAIARRAISIRRTRATRA